MKKCVLFAAIFFLASCSPRLTPRIVDVNFFDYRPYTENGFFLSPDPFTGKFSPCGELYIKVFPGQVKAADKQKSKETFDALYSTAPAMKMRTEVIGADELLKIAVDEAKKVGANGIANLKCEVSSTIYNSKTREYELTAEYYEIRGFAIKIKE